MKIKEILESLYEAGEYHYSAKSNDKYKQKDISQAHTAILKELEGMMPPKETCKEGEQYWMWNSLHNVYEYGVMIGRNQILAYLKSSLKNGVYAAECVIDIYEKKYPDDKRPREAIEAAKKCIENPSKENKEAAAEAAEAAMRKKILDYGINLLSSLKNEGGGE